MANVGARGGSQRPKMGTLSTNQTGNAASTNAIDTGTHTDSALLRITTAVGATPTVTVAIEGSMDATGWYPVPYSDPATPTTVTTATFVLTTAGTVYKFLTAGYPWRYLRLSYSLNTNVTITSDVWVF